MARRYYNKRDRYGRWSNGATSKPPVRRSGSKSGRAAGAASRSATGVPSRRQQAYESRVKAQRTAKRKATAKKVVVATAVVATVAVGAYVATRNPNASGKMAQAVNQKLFVSPRIKPTIGIRPGAMGPGSRAAYIKAAKTSAAKASAAASMATGVSATLKDIKQATKTPNVPNLPKAEPIGVSPQNRRKGDAFREHINSKQHSLASPGLPKTASNPITASVPSAPAVEQGPAVPATGGKNTVAKAGEILKTYHEYQGTIAQTAKAIRAVNPNTGTADNKPGDAFYKPITAGTVLPEHGPAVGKTTRANQARRRKRRENLAAMEKNDATQSPKATPVTGGVSTVKAEAAMQKVKTPKAKANPTANPTPTKTVMSDGVTVKSVTQMSKEERAELYKRGAEARQKLADLERQAGVNVGAQELAEFEKKNPKNTMYASIKGNVVHEGSTRTDADIRRAAEFQKARAAQMKKERRRVAKALTGEDARIEELEKLVAGGKATRADRLELKGLMGY